MDGLALAGFDVELRQFGSSEDLRTFVTEGQPVIAVLRHPSGSLHAVVVCDVGDDVVTFMDPATGSYTAIPRERFDHLWGFVQNEGVLVTGRAVRPARSGDA